MVTRQFFSLHSLMAFTGNGLCAWNGDDGVFALVLMVDVVMLSAYRSSVWTMPCVSPKKSWDEEPAQHVYRGASRCSCCEDESVSLSILLLAGDDGMIGIGRDPSGWIEKKLPRCFHEEDFVSLEVVVIAAVVALFFTSKILLSCYRCISYMTITISIYSILSPFLVSFFLLLPFGACIVLSFQKSLLFQGERKQRAKKINHLFFYFYDALQKNWKRDIRRTTEDSREEDEI